MPNRHIQCAGIITVLHIFNLCMDYGACKDEKIRLTPFILLQFYKSTSFRQLKNHINVRGYIPVALLTLWRRNYFLILAHQSSHKLIPTAATACSCVIAASSLSHSSRSTAHMTMFRNSAVSDIRTECL